MAWPGAGAMSLQERKQRAETASSDELLGVRRQQAGQRIAAVLLLELRDAERGAAPSSWATAGATCPCATLTTRPICWSAAAASSPAEGIASSLAFSCAVAAPTACTRGSAACACRSTG